MNCLNFGGILENYWKESDVGTELHEALQIFKVRSIISKLTSNISNSVEFVFPESRLQEPECFNGYIEWKFQPRKCGYFYELTPRTGVLNDLQY